MLRVSDFCRGPLSPVPSSGSRRRRRPSFDNSDDDGAHNDSKNNSFESTVLPPILSTENSFDCKCEQTESSCAVRLRVWKHPISAPEEADACVKIPLDVLKDLFLRDGDFAVLEKHGLAGANEKDTTHADTLLRKIVVRLKLMDEDEERTVLNFSGSNLSNDNSKNVCLVPPIVLANLGISPQTIWQQSKNGFVTLAEHRTVFRLREIHEENGGGSSSGEGGVGVGSPPWQVAQGKRTEPVKAKVAKRVLLRPLGRAPMWPRFSLTPPVTLQEETNQNQTNDNTKDEHYTLDKNSTTDSKHDEDEVWIFPSRSGIILQESILCEVRSNTNSHGGNHNVCYYEILRIFSGENVGDEADEEKTLHRDDFYITASITQFELDSFPLSGLPYVRRLPLPSPFSLDHDGDDSARLDNERQKNGTKSIEKPSNESMVKPRKLFELPEPHSGGVESEGDYAFSCHPDWKNVAKALLDAPAMIGNSIDESYISNDSRILHIIGTDTDHDVQTCVVTASNMIGMQCLSINGLAAFGYEHRRGKRGNTVTSGVSVRSPMIEQQLAGIDAALEYIVTRRMEPCVLHLVGVDEELATVANDDPLRCQIEDRFWSKCMDVVSRKKLKEDSSQKRSVHNGYDYYCGVGKDRLDYCYTPRLLIVISTKVPLKRGPWLERLIFPSLSLSLPDDKYIHFLWKMPNDRKQQTSAILTEEAMSLLRGRGAKEIVQLRKLLDFELLQSSLGDVDGTDPNSNEMFQILENLCKGFDAGRRNASSDVARISNVSWEDVGGLDHVRAEILDAIELPLKHPHLFPPNTGRSGILLFGPPGTGKTLVAKAVATECGLPFLSVKGPELLGSYIGESEANIRKVFASARLAAENNLPIQASILFFDELDSLAPKRGGNNNHGGGVMERVVASLLAELDGGGNDNSGRIFVLGATNRPDLLDPSLLRPGRLDRLVYLGIPTDDDERIRVLASQLRKMKLEGDALHMARSVIEEGLPPRLSGADMSKLSSGAMLHAIRRLCLEADEERERILKQQQDSNSTSNVTIDEILESWGEEKCTPIITLNDLRLASKDVSPSVSAEEMKRYEYLREEHETSSHK